MPEKYERTARSIKAEIISNKTQRNNIDKLPLECEKIFAGLSEMQTILIKDKEVQKEEIDKRKRQGTDNRAEALKRKQFKKELFTAGSEEKQSKEKVKENALTNNTTGTITTPNNEKAKNNDIRWYFEISKSVLR